MSAARRAAVMAQARSGPRMSRMPRMPRRHTTDRLHCAHSCRQQRQRQRQGCLPTPGQLHLAIFHRGLSSCARLFTDSSSSSSKSSKSSTDPVSNPSTLQPQPPPSLNPAELSIFTNLRAHFTPTKLSVEDISGGCGSMYAIEIESSHFKGQSLVKQQRMVNEVLKEEMERDEWHGVRIKTGVGA